MCIWIQLILLKTKNNNNNLLFMLESTVHMLDCTVTIIKNYCPCLIVLFICLIVLFMSHEQCNRRWFKKKKKLKTKIIWTWTRKPNQPFISEQGLIYLPLEGGTFTWSNSKEVASRSRLDRFLLSSDWEEHIPNICQRQLQRLLLDHFPILVEGGNFQRDSRPVRFENMSLMADGYIYLV